MGDVHQPRPTFSATVPRAPRNLPPAVLLFSRPEGTPGRKVLACRRATKPVDSRRKKHFSEGRRLMSGGGGGGGHHGGGHGGFGGVFGAGGSTITYAEAPSAVQTGLTSLAGTDGVTAPTSTTTVKLGNANGVETYTVDVQGT